MLTAPSLSSLRSIRHAFFTREGGDAYLRDLPKAEIHRLDSGHFAVEDHAPYIAEKMIAFHAPMSRWRVARAASSDTPDSAAPISCATSCPSAA